MVGQGEHGHHGLVRPVAFNPTREVWAMTIYRYGWVAWVWRLLVGGLLGASAFLLLIAVHFGDWWLGAGVILVGVPVVVLPWMLATRIDRTAEEEIVVTNLFFVRRRISRSALGFPRLRLIAHGAVKTRAPRAWIPAQGGLPIYVDLYGTFPDPVAFRSFFRVPRRWASVMGG